jgi:hypothetical protein
VVGEQGPGGVCEDSSSGGSEGGSVGRDEEVIKGADRVVVAVESRNVRIRGETL